MGPGALRLQEEEVGGFDWRGPDPLTGPWLRAKLLGIPAH